MVRNVISPEFDEQGRILKRLRSFVRRQGRITKRQQYAIDKFWPIMGINYSSQPLDFIGLFGRAAPIIIEIGFGMGESLINMAIDFPHYNFIGIEVYLPGIGACLARAQELRVYNLRVIYHDAVEVLEKMIPEESLVLVQLFFPDPWHKTRHNKRRIIQAPFVDIVGRKLATRGILHIVTDWKPYAEHILTVMSNVAFFHNLSFTGDYVPRPASRPLTKFEQRSQRLGYGVWDLMFTKNA